jgi:hypothetical protein
VEARVSLSVALMAHPSRKAFVDELIERLDREPEIVWDRRNDRWDTGRRSMLAHDPAADWHLVIQDDAIPCCDLVAGVEQACQVAADRPLAFYVGRLRPTNVQHQAGALVDNAARRGASWIQMEGPWWGPAIAVPTAHIADMLAWGDRRDDPASPDYIANYDKRISRYYASQGIDCWYSVPSLVDHRPASENPSLVPGRHGNRQAHQFIGAERSALEIDWTRTPQEALMATHRNTKTGNTIDVVPGTALAKAVEGSPDWECIEAATATEAQGDADPGTTKTDDPDDRVDLTKLGRDALDARAAEVGVEDPDKLPNKQAVIDAIEAATATEAAVA